MKRKWLYYAAALLLTVVIHFGILAARKPLSYVTASNGNSRPTYFTMHRIGEAQHFATGRGVKIGIIDHYFGFDENQSLYAGGADFLDDSESFRKIGEHGLWLTRTAKEIAPGAEIYALNATTDDDGRKVEAMVKAIDWAIAHKLDVLTYSNRAFSPANRPKIDAAVARATAAGINCVFIHYAHPLNLLPFPMLPPSSETSYERPADINVYHYDYNMLLLDHYKRFNRGERVAPPYLSLSSTSVVAAAVLAMLREIDGSLSPSEYKQILIATSRPYQETKQQGPEIIRNCDHVMDAMAAVELMRHRVVHADPSRS